MLVVFLNSKRVIHTEFTKSTTKINTVYYNNIKLGIHLQTLCSRTCLESLFFHKLPANQEKLTNQLRTTGSCVKIVGDIGKSYCEHGREQKFGQTSYTLSCEHPLCSFKKTTGDDSQRTVRKLHHNYTNIVFANEMFASVYEALRIIFWDFSWHFTTTFQNIFPISIKFLKLITFF